MKTVRITALAAAAALAVTTGGVGAQSTSEQSATDLPVTAEMDIHVTETAEKAIDKYLDNAHKLVLKTVAYQHAIARNCDGFDLDQDRYREEMEYAFEKVEALPDGEEKENAHIIVMMGYGMLLGGQFAIAAYNYDDYCAHAEDDYASVEGDKEHVILVKN